MADIFLVRATAEAGVDRYMVLKRVLASRAKDPVFSQLFLDEARLAAQLQHPNIAQVYDVGRLGGSYFFSMEYVHGEDLRVVLKHCAGKKQLIPINLAVYVATGALAALHHAHERTTPEGRPLGIVHRDVSHSNIMISYEGSVKMIDFGVAKAAQRTTNTNAGSIKGKFGYMSPEQVKGDDVDRRSDVFSLGIVLYEMLTGKRLYRRDNDYAAMSAVVHEDAPPPSRQRPEISEEIDRIVLTALTRDKDKRYPTAQAMLEDLEAVATAERFLLSANAMSRFMREQFGVKPEPWHVLRDQVGEQLEIASEAVPEGHATQTEIPIEIGVDDIVDQLADAPLLRPQDMGHATPTPVVDGVSAPTAISSEPSSFTSTPSQSSFTPSSSPSSPSFQSQPSGTPMPVAPPARSKRVAVIVAAAVIAIGIGVVTFSGMLGGDGSGTETAHAEPPPETQPTTETKPTAEVTPQTPEVKPPPQPPAKLPTTLEVTITGVKDAVVRVDGAERGRGTSVKLELAPGPHDLVVEAAGRPAVTKHVDLGEGRATMIEIVVPVATTAENPKKPPRPAKDPCSNRDYVKKHPLECQ